MKKGLGLKNKQHFWLYHLYNGLLSQFINGILVHLVYCDDRDTNPMIS